MKVHGQLKYALETEYLSLCHFAVYTAVVSMTEIGFSEEWIVPT